MIQRLAETVKLSFTPSTFYFTNVNMYTYSPVLRIGAKRLSTTARPASVRCYAAHATPQPFKWQDPLDSQSLLTEEELAIAETAEAYCQERMLPRVLGLFC